MIWDVRQTRRFSRTYKKLDENLVREVDDAIRAVAQDPDIGEKKKGISANCGSTSFAASASYTCWATPVMMVCS